MPDNDYVLLRLMHKYKPHLRKYPERLQTWERVLKDYNSKRGTNYKQSRSLRKKFQNLKANYQKKDGRKLISVKVVKLLEMIIKEENDVFNEKLIEVTNVGEGQVEDSNEEGSDSEEEPEMTLGVDNETSRIREKPITAMKNSDFLNKDYGLVDNINSDIPPLDSLKVGYPHSRNASLGHLDLVAVAHDNYTKAIKNFGKPAFLSPIVNHFSSNYVTESINASDHLPSATQIDRELLNTLISDVKEIKNFQEEFKKTILSELDTLKKQIQDLCNK